MQANWNDVLKLGLSVYAHQRIELQILIGLAVAFSAVMIVEGLRANFFPGRRAAAIQQVAAPEEKPDIGLPEAQPSHQAFAIGATQHFAPRRMQNYAQNPKRKLAVMRTQKAPRPTIKRMANAQFSQGEPPAT